jgi:hypothetical protein
MDWRSLSLRLLLGALFFSGFGRESFTLDLDESAIIVGYLKEADAHSAAHDLFFRDVCIRPYDLDLCRNGLPVRDVYSDAKGLIQRERIFTLDECTSKGDVGDFTLHLNLADFDHYRP